MLSVGGSGTSNPMKQRVPSDLRDVVLAEATFDSF